MNVRTIIGRRPQISRGDTHTQIDTVLSGFFRVVHTESAGGVQNYFPPPTIIPPPPIPSHEFRDNTCFINCHVINAPPVKESSRVVEMGHFARYRGYGHNRWMRPVTNRRIPSEEIIIFRFRNITKGFYYPRHQTLVIARMGYDYRSLANLDTIWRWLRAPENQLTLRPIPEDEQPATAARVKLLVGTDPEFEVLGPTLQPIMPERGEYSDYLRASIGLDGAGSQLEFRPKAGTVDQVVKELTALMKKVKHRICTTGHRYSLGGHIHLGYGHSYQPTSDLLWLLDQYLGLPTIDLSGRARGGYKCLSAVETKPHGFEYRSCPAAIFDHPELARLSMTIAQNVCERYANGGMFTVRQHGVGREEYVNCGILRDDDYDRWVYMLTNYPSEPYDCRVNWAPANELAQPIERLLTAAEIQAEMLARQDEIRCHEEDVRRAQERNELDRAARDADRERRAAREQAILAAQAVDSMGLSFADDWVPSTITQMRDLIRAGTQDNIQFFGLSQSREAVTYGYEVEGYQRLALAEHESWAGRYGIPWRLRMGHEPEEMMRRHAAAILEVHRVGGNAVPLHVTEAMGRVATLVNRHAAPIRLRRPNSAPDPVPDPVELVNPFAPPVIDRWTMMPPEPIPFSEDAASYLAPPTEAITPPPITQLQERRNMYDNFLLDVTTGLNNTEDPLDQTVAVEMLRIRRRQLGLRALSSGGLRLALGIASPPRVEMEEPGDDEGGNDPGTATPPSEQTFEQLIRRHGVSFRRDVEQTRHDLLRGGFINIDSCIERLQEYRRDRRMHPLHVDQLRRLLTCA